MSHYSQLGLLGEMTLLPGGEILMSKEPEKVDEHGLMHAISYAAQTPWLQHQSIKENILFGSPFDEARYKAVVECCALLPDLKMLEDGDLTEIGARGVSLSGGQKARYDSFTFTPSQQALTYLCKTCSGTSGLCTNEVCLVG